MTEYKVVALSEHPNLWQQAAQWSFDAWQHECPGDTVQTYLDQYALAATKPERLIEIYAAISDQEQLLGVATLIDDDELPDAHEPGPWLAAVFVTPTERKAGVGSALVDRIVRRARELNFVTLYLYTEFAEDWYQQKDWQKIRDTEFLGLQHTVMQLKLVN